MKHFLLKLVFFGIVFLGACSKSEFDACYKAETEKLRLSYRLAMTVEQNELVNDVLPILLTDTADKKTFGMIFLSLKMNGRSHLKVKNTVISTGQIIQ